MSGWHWLVILLVSGLVFSIWAFQRWGIYEFPKTEETPAAYGLSEVVVKELISEDGARIQIWVSSPDEGAPTILSFYGNAAKIGGSMERFKPLMAKGYGIVVMQYRGASGDKNRSSERGFAMDARALYDQMDNLTGSVVPPERRILHGLSLGSAVGARLASERKFGAVILEASMPRACRYYTKRYRGFPFCYLMWSERYDTVDLIARVTAPKLFVHGAKDKSLPFEWAVQLAEVAPDPKRIVVFPDGGHADLAKHGLIDLMSEFIEDVIPSAE